MKQQILGITPPLHFVYIVSYYTLAEQTLTDRLTDQPTEQPTDQPTDRSTDRPTVRPTEPTLSGIEIVSKSM